MSSMLEQRLRSMIMRNMYITPTYYGHYEQPSHYQSFLDSFHDPSSHNIYIWDIIHYEIVKDVKKIDGNYWVTIKGTRSRNNRNFKNDELKNKFNKLTKNCPKGELVIFIDIYDQIIKEVVNNEP